MGGFLGCSYLTGCQYHTYISVQRGSLYASLVQPSRVHRNMRKVPRGALMDSDEAWQLLLEGQQRGAMLCCAWDGKGKEAIEKGTGLVSQHCYTVVQVRNVSNGF